MKDEASEKGGGYESVYLQQILFEIVKEGYGELDELVKLLEQGSIFDIANSQEEGTQKTALHYACSLGKMQMVNALLEAGANALHTDRYGFTALHDAVQNGQVKAALVVLKYFPVVTFDNVGPLSLIHCAAMNGQTRMLKCLLDRDAGFHERNEEGETALHLAAKFDHATCIKMLAKAGAHVDARAAATGHTPLHYAAAHGNAAAALALQAAGASLHLRNALPLGRTPLEAAKDCGHWRLYNALLKEDRRLLIRENHRLQEAEREVTNALRATSTRAFRAKNQYLQVKADLALQQEYERTVLTDEAERRRLRRRVRQGLSSQQRTRPAAGSAPPSSSSRGGGAGSRAPSSSSRGGGMDSSRLATPPPSRRAAAAAAAAAGGEEGAGDEGGRGASRDGGGRRVLPAAAGRLAGVVEGGGEGGAGGRQWEEGEEEHDG